jgi:anti-sigma factor (TIGR02949 family)
MKPCDDYAVKILRYLDDDLEGDELREFRIHVVSCENCRAHLAAERALSKLLGRTRPWYRAPEALRAHVGLGRWSEKV